MKRLQELAELAADDSRFQLSGDGFGRLVHRTYWVNFATSISASSLMDAMQSSPDTFCDPKLATFDKRVGEPDELKLGDQFNIRITGPWDGPVEVIDVAQDRFAFVTLRGHLEAGFIEFSVRETILNGSQNIVQFQISSWANSGGPIVWLTYEIMKVTKFMQTLMWVRFSENVVKFADGDMRGKIESTTKKLSLKSVPAKAVSEPAPRYSGLTSLGFNYDANEYQDDQPGWNRDYYETCIGEEAPGDPHDGGMFERAKEILRQYQFPSPKRLTGYFDHEADLLGRDMLLEAKFMGLQFDFGVRVTKVIDRSTVDEEGKSIAQWGYAYRTLERHWEVGEITFVIQKEKDSGRIHFVIDAYSRPGKIRNPFYRLGFKLFGRRLQTRFAEDCLVRMKALAKQSA